MSCEEMDALYEEQEKFNKQHIENIRAAHIEKREHDHLKKGWYAHRREARLTAGKRV